MILFSCIAFRAGRQTSETHMCVRYEEKVKEGEQEEDIKRVGWNICQFLILKTCTCEWEFREEDGFASSSASWTFAGCWAMLDDIPVSVMHCRPCALNNAPCRRFEKGERLGMWEFIYVRMQCWNRAGESERGCTTSGGLTSPSYSPTENPRVARSFSN